MTTEVSREYTTFAMRTTERDTRRERTRPFVEIDVSRSDLLRAEAARINHEVGAGHLQVPRANVNTDGECQLTDGDNATWAPETVLIDATNFELASGTATCEPGPFIAIDAPAEGYQVARAYREAQLERSELREEDDALAAEESDLEAEHRVRLADRGRRGTSSARHRRLAARPSGRTRRCRN